MKKIALLFSMLFAVLANTNAQITVSLNDLSAKVGNVDTLYVTFNNPNEAEYWAYQLDINLPDGCTMQSWENVSDKVAGADMISTELSTTSGSSYRFIAYAGNEFNGGKAYSGNMLMIIVSVNSELTNASVTASNIHLAQYDENSLKVEDIYASETSATVSSIAPVSLTLSETSTKSIADQLSEAGISSSLSIDELTVERTIKANSWNTIVLPFSMDEEEIYDAFGSDVTLGSLTSWEKSDEVNAETGRPTSVYVNISNYDAANGMTANTPYFIKTTTAVSSFTVYNKVVSTVAQPKIEIPLNGSEEENDYGKMIGKYVYYTIPSKALFVSSNTMYYSTGNTNSKGFRAYIYLPEVADGFSTNTSSTSNVKVGVNYESEATGIQETTVTSAKAGKIYNLSGQYVGTEVEKLPAGVYVKNGEKISVK